MSWFPDALDSMHHLTISASYSSSLCALISRLVSGALSRPTSRTELSLPSQHAYPSRLVSSSNEESQIWSALVVYIIFNKNADLSFGLLFVLHLLFLCLHCRHCFPLLLSFFVSRVACFGSEGTSRFMPLLAYDWISSCTSTWKARRKIAAEVHQTYHSYACPAAWPLPLEGEQQLLPLL